MNVIIRLQNLPWSANATDIRNFFKGLMIPEGGVHIVGGENGDAFIAFSSDEDARQAMQMNGGKIKETQVSLLLSSRAEMQKVIEKARQASSSAFAITKVTTQTPSAASIANQFAKKLPEAAVVMPPQPPVISLSSFLTQSMQQQVPPHVSVTQPQQLNLMSAYQTALASNDMAGLSGLASLPPVGIPNQNAAAAAAAYYAALMDPNAMNYANPMTAGLNLKPPVANVQAANYLNDPRGRRSNSRERKRYRSRSPERKLSRRSRSTSRERYTDSDGKDGSRRRTRFSAAQDRIEIPKHSALAPVISSSSSSSFMIPPPSNNIWEHPPPQVFAHEVNAQQNNLSSYANYKSGNSNPTPRNYQTEHSAQAASASFGNIGTCVKVSNVDSETFYSDLRKFFVGLPIGQNDIKFVTDGKGNRTGAVLIRFLSSDSKKKALTKSMWQLKSTQVLITSCTEEDFESGLANAKPGNRVNQANNYRNDDRYDSRNDRYRERSDSRDRDYPKRDRYDGNHGGNNQNDDRPINNRDAGNFRQREPVDRNPPRNYRTEEQEKPKEYKPDENFTVLIIDDIPRTANEPDVCEAFPNIVSIVIDRYTAYVKFSSHEAAKVTLENRFIHYIRNKRVFLEAGSEAQFSDIARKNGKFDNPDNKESNDSGNGSENVFNSEINDDSNSRDSSRNQKPFESRDPRQRNFGNDRRNDNQFAGNGNSGPPNQIKTDCIIMKNMEPDTTIEEVENFFKDLGIYKMRVHILLDKRGQPCGDCFVEFKFPNDSTRAVVKNNQMLKNNRVTVMLIPREQVQAVLSSFGGDDRPQPPMNMQNRNRRNDWSPPEDFGSPGCVVMLSNLSYRATTEDILDCFREFELHPDQVIRRFNDMGQPTGNACVNFNSQDDCEMALEKYNSAKIMDRPVWLKRA